MSTHEYGLSLNYGSTDLERDLDTFWKDLQKGGDVEAEAKELGINVELVSKLERADVLEVRTVEGALEPLLTTILIAAAPKLSELAAKVAYDIWAQVLLPRIRREKGKDLLPPK